jgi:uncharacterized membrane protein YraQ (UPF0718 family)
MKNAQTNSKKKEKLTISRIAKKTKIRNQTLRNKIKNYINNINEILTYLIVNLIIMWFNNR